MKKLFCLLFASALMGIILCMEQSVPAAAGSAEPVVLDSPQQALLAPEFQVSPLIMQFARDGARQYGLTQLPLICKIKPNTSVIKPNTFCAAAALSQRAIKIVLRLDQPSAIEQEQISRWVNQLLSCGYESFEILTHMYDSCHEPQAAIILFPDFFECSYGVQKSFLLHELWHIKQYEAVCDLKTPSILPLAIDSLTYPRGAEQEADMKAAYAINCYPCIKAFAAQRWHAPHEYARVEEIFTIASQVPDGQVCSYHKNIEVRKEY